MAELGAQGASVHPTSLPAFLEHYLGPIQDGLPASTWGFPESVMVARFAGVPFPEATTHCTLGLSKYELHPDQGHVRIELMMCARTEDAAHERAGVLHHLAHECIETSEPLVIGQGIQLPGKVFSDTEMTALLVTKPYLWGEHFARFEPVRAAPINLLMLVPIYAAELDWVNMHGEEAFRSELGRIGSQVLDAQRSPVFG